MKIEHLDEPDLQFGYGKHIDIRFGIMNHSVFDVKTNAKNIAIAVIGSNESIENFIDWITICKTEIPPKESKQPNLFPKFCGFSVDTGFHAEVIIDDSQNRTLSHIELDKICKSSNKGYLIESAVNLFIQEIEYIAEKRKTDVIICSIPPVLANELLKSDELQPSSTLDKDVNEEQAHENDSEEIEVTNFRRLLKAKAMKFRIPIQIVLPHTFIENHKYPSTVKRHQNVQDNSTKAWNFFTALYYKAGGIPWRLIKNPLALDTCYAGISFYKAKDGTTQTSLAQVFDERGLGVILKGGKAEESKEDKIPHLSEEESYKIMINIVDNYRKEHKHSPARIVLHKTSKYTKDEMKGLIAGLQEKQIENFDFLTLFKSKIRLFRQGSYPPLRGTKLFLDEKNHILYTRGSVNFFQTYPGKYVPKTLEVRCSNTQQTPLFLCKEILALTKMNWNNTQFDGELPITLRCAQQVGDILKYLNEGDQIAPNYSFYM